MCSLHKQAIAKPSDSDNIQKFMHSNSILITTMKRIALLTIFIVAGLGAGSASLISCASKSSADSTAKSAQEIVSVQTTKVELHPIAATLKVTGSLERQARG